MPHLPIPGKESKGTCKAPKSSTEEKEHQNVKYRQGSTPSTSPSQHTIEPSKEKRILIMLGVFSPASEPQTLPDSPPGLTKLQSITPQCHGCPQFGRWGWSRCQCSSLEQSTKHCPGCSQLWDVPAAPSLKIKFLWRSLCSTKQGGCQEASGARNLKSFRINYKLTRGRRGVSHNFGITLLNSTPCSLLSYLTVTMPEGQNHFKCLEKMRIFNLSLMRSSVLIGYKYEIWLNLEE